MEVPRALPVGVPYNQLSMNTPFRISDDEIPVRHRRESLHSGWESDQSFSSIRENRGIDPYGIFGDSIEPCHSQSSSTDEIVLKIISEFTYPQEIFISPHPI